jgi:hypothetical protein
VEVYCSPQGEAFYHPLVYVTSSALRLTANSSKASTSPTSVVAAPLMFAFPSITAGRFALMHEHSQLDTE